VGASVTVEMGNVPSGIFVLISLVRSLRAARTLRSFVVAGVMIDRGCNLIPISYEP